MDPETYGVDNINVPVYNNYVLNDLVCNEVNQQVIGDTILTQQTRVTFLERSHRDIVGDLDAAYLTIFLGQLGGASSEIDGVCANLNFDTWI